MKMGSCRICLKYTQVDESGNLCSKCQATDKKISTSIRFVFCDGKIRIENSLTKRIISKSEWFDIKRYVDAYYFSVTQDEIDEINSIRDHNISNRKKVNKSGNIYLMVSSNGYYKIGRGYNVESRKKGHMRDYPLQIKILHSFHVEDYVRAETYLLRIFKDKRLQGEWFNLDDQDIKFITSITDEIARTLF